VRVFGTIRMFQGAKSVVAYSIRPVVDFNEVTFHFLEVISVQKQLAAKHGGVAMAGGAGRPAAGGCGFGGGGGGGMGGGAGAGAPAANAGYGAWRGTRSATHCACTLLRKRISHASIHLICMPSDETRMWDAPPPSSLSGAYGGGSAYGAPPAGGGGMGGGGGGGGGGGVAVTGDCAADVLRVFNMPFGRDEKGVSLTIVASTLGGRYTAAAIRDAVEKHINDGACALFARFALCVLAECCVCSVVALCRSAVQHHG
jgi:hypothetical protein